MKIIMYGAEICPDCVEAKALLSASAQVELEYRDITKSTKTLKEFLSYRDHEELFAPVVKDGKIGIPFFILEDGTKTLEVRDIVETGQAQLQSSCAIDGKGHC